MRIDLIKIFGLVLFAATIAHSAFASENIMPQLNFDTKAMQGAPVYLEADQVDYNRESGLVTARGKVQITQGERFVIADALTFSERENRVTATGNVIVKDAGGETIYADFVELRDDFKNGSIENLRLRLSDNSRMAAKTVERTGGNSKTMRYAAFTPCLPCAKHPERAPTWQIKAKKVVHDEAAHEIRYEDARFELWGTPVFYTPYLSHPDPELKRKTGLLAPQISNSSTLGTTYRQPIYIAISPSEDITFEPTIMSKDGFILGTDYRKRFDNALLSMKTSIGDVDKRSSAGDDSKAVRGHIDSKLLVDLDDHWRANLDVNRATDKTYLRRYRFSGDDVLISRAQTEGFFGKSYAQFRALSFQGLRDFDKGRTTPIILPQLRYDYASDFDQFGGLWKINTDILNLQRSKGADVERLGVNASWHKPMRTDGGHLFDLELRTQASGYNINNYDDPSTTLVENKNSLRGRATPQASLSWRYPLAGKLAIDDKEILTKYLEPVVSVVGAPNVGQNSKIPNEDSQAFEFDESNLFSSKRFPGYDRVAGGQRVDYGLNLGLFDDYSRGGKVFVGQSWRPREDNTYAKGSGLKNNFSDVVGKVEINPGEKLDLIYRFRIDPDQASFRRSEFSAETHAAPIRVGLDYIFLDKLVGNNEFNDREQLGARASWQLTDQWNLSGRILGDINTRTSLREWATGLTYRDECISSGISVEREFVSDGENRPGTSFMFRIDLKHLGGELQNDYFTPRRGNAYTGTLLPQY